MIVEVGSKTDISGMKVIVYPPGYIIGNPYSPPRKRLYHWFMNPDTGEVLYFKSGRNTVGSHYKTVHVVPDDYTDFAE